MNFAYSVPLPTGFPECIQEQFPNKSYKEQLKAAIAALQQEVNHEKAAAAHG